jgi:hypothetical protein
MESIIISEDKKSIENLERLSVRYTLEFNSVLKTIREFTTVQTIEQFIAGYRDLKQVVIDEAIEGLPKTLKVLKREALEGMVELPEELPNALNKIQALKNAKQSSQIFQTLDFNNEFELNQQKFESLLDYYRVRISDEAQIKKYNELKKVCDAINEAGLIKNGSLGGILINFKMKEGILHPAAAVVQRAV